MNGVISKGIFSRGDRSSKGRALIRVIWSRHGSSLMREPSGNAAICSNWLSRRRETRQRSASGKNVPPRMLLSRKPNRAKARSLR